VDTATIKLHYWEWPGEEPALLCLHGLTANGRCWDALAERLGQRLLAVDLRGRGLSDKPPPGQYGLQRHAQDMVDLLHALRLNSVIAIGWSMGAWIAALLAADHPALVSQMVLIDGGYFEEQATEAQVRTQLAAALQRLTLVFPSRPSYVDYWKQMPYVQPWTEHFERYLAADLEERPDGSVVSRVSAGGVEEDFLSLFRMRETWSQTVRQVQVPALVLWAPLGLADPRLPLFPHHALKQLTALLPQGRLITIEGANHYTIVFSPHSLGQVMVALKDFLKFLQA
jgi:pimeloyl-ACP methyl ester carboxylesterase